MSTNNAWNNSITAASSTLNGGTVSIGTDSADNAINIGTAGSSGRTTTIGNTTSASTLNLKCGTGNFSLASASGTIISVNNSGTMNIPIQSAFSAYLASDVTNATGDSAVWQLGTTTALTVVFDQHSDFNTNGTFTAPVTGKYLFRASFKISNLTSSMTESSFRIITTAVSWTVGFANIYILSDATGAWNNHYAFFTSMTAGDTAVTSVAVIGGSGNTATVNGDGTLTSSFSGFLVC